jgi:hypothetical protein
MSFETTPLRGVRQNYGTRNTGYALGVVKTEGSSNELSVDITGETLANNAFAKVVIPAGSIVTNAYFETTEAFDLGGTTPTILVGTKGSEATNGVVVAEAEAEAIGSGDITASLQGTWAAGSGLAADTEVGVALGGTTPTVDAALGDITVTVVYKKLAATG